ncbi:MAG TPA: archaeosortase/exosortase family protein [Opitutaceae bacterium]
MEETDTAAPHWWERRGPVAFALLVASWPVLRWYGVRLDDGGDEPWGLVALVLALLLTPRRHAWSRLPGAAAGIAATLVIAAAIGSGALPMLARGMLVAAAVGIVLGGVRGAWGRAGLLALSLPVTATLQFYAGYPLRVVTAELGRPLLALAGVATERAGVVLVWAGGEVAVDAPCSGVRMLWTSGVLAGVLASLAGLNATGTVCFGLAALVLVIVGNALRAALLFFPEAGFWPASDAVHAAVGLVLFAGVCSGLAGLVRVFRAKEAR